MQIYTEGNRRRAGVQVRAPMQTLDRCLVMGRYGLGAGVGSEAHSPALGFCRGGEDGDPMGDEGVEDDEEDDGEYGEDETDTVVERDGRDAGAGRLFGGDEEDEEEDDNDEEEEPQSSRLGMEEKQMTIWPNLGRRHSSTSRFLKFSKFLVLTREFDSISRRVSSRSSSNNDRTPPIAFTLFLSSSLAITTSGSDNKIASDGA